MVSRDSPWGNVSVRVFKGWRWNGMRCINIFNENLYKPIRVFIL
jgi:hypothetical protein